MRNRNKINQLGRTTSHRNALMMNLANALITHKRISTTLAKAKALRGYVEPLITKSKEDTTHSRRMVFRHLQSKDAVAELFRNVAPQVGERPGGYTRIIKTGFRAGDSAEMCIIELVDFNEVYTTEKKAQAGKKTRRSRRGGGGSSKETESTKTASKSEETSAAAAAAEVAEEVVEKAEEVVEKAEDAVEEAVEAAPDAVEDVVEEVTGSTKDESKEESSEDASESEEEEKKD